MSYQRLSAQDASFLEIEEPQAPMHVGGCFIFEGSSLLRADGGLDIDAVRSFVEARLHRMPRYRQRIERIPVSGHPIWVDDERFNIHYHVRHSALPAPGDERQLKRLCGRVLSQALDPGKPLWEMWLVEGLEHERFALITKVHHCMIDGISGAELLQVLLSVTPEKRIDVAPEFVPERAPSALALLGDAAARRVLQPLTLAASAAELARGGASGVRARAREIASGLLSNLRVSLYSTDPTPFNQPVGPHRRFDWLAFDLEAVKRVKQRLGGTVNDVVLATVSGAVSRFLEQRGITLQRQRELEFRAICPVSVRSSDEQGALGNRVASMVARLPIADRDPAGRLRRVSQVTADLKTSKQAVGAEVLAGVSEWTAPSVMTQAMRIAFSQRTANLVITNIPGPQLPLYLLGARMVESYPMAPLFRTQGLSIALFSYAGGLFWGFNADWDLLPDLHQLVIATDASFVELCEAAEAHVAS